MSCIFSTLSSPRYTSGARTQSDDRAFVCVVRPRGVEPSSLSPIKRINSIVIAYGVTNQSCMAAAHSVNRDVLALKTMRFSFVPLPPTRAIASQADRWRANRCLNGSLVRLAPNPIRTAPGRTNGSLRRRERHGDDLQLLLQLQTRPGTRISLNRQVDLSIERKGFFIFQCAAK